MNFNELIETKINGNNGVYKRAIKNMRKVKLIEFILYIMDGERSNLDAKDWIENIGRCLA